AAQNLPGLLQLIPMLAAPQHAPAARPRQAESDETARLVQIRLNALGYDAGPPDGAIGPRTRRAIAAFQADRGLPADGVPGRSTLAALETAWRQQASTPSGGSATPSPVTAETAAEAG